MNEKIEIYNYKENENSLKELVTEELNDGWCVKLMYQAQLNEYKPSIIVIYEKPTEK
jgi:hypothetical protein